MRAPVLVLASLALLVVSVYAVPPKLRLRSDGTFTVLQLADLHYGEGENVAWGPQQARFFLLYDANRIRIVL